MLYHEFLEELKGFADESYKAFHKKLLNNDAVNVIGVRIPQLRVLAKKYKSEVETLLTFPDEYYEVTFVKLTVVALLPYEKFIRYVDGCVGLIDNWATCDCFAPKWQSQSRACLKNNSNFLWGNIEIDMSFIMGFVRN